MADAIRIGVIGTGVFGISHLRVFKQAQNEGRTVLVAACSSGRDPARDQERKDEFGIPIYTDWREMLDNESLDAVTIVTPDHLHREMTVEAANRGLHVLVEKPLDVTSAGCREIVDACKANQVFLQVDFHKRYDPYHLALERQCNDGTLGEVLYGYVHMEDKIVVPRDWFPHWAGSTSPAWFLGVHFYDLVRWCIKKDATKVYATGRKKKLAALGIDTYDCIQAKVEFEGGASVFFDNGWVLPDTFEAIVNQSIRLVGTEGFAEVDSQNRGMEAASYKDGMRTYNEAFMREEEDKHGQVVYRGYGYESILDFVDNLEFLQEGGTIDQLEGRYPSGEDALEVTRIAEAVHQSIDSGSIVSLK